MNKSDNLISQNLKHILWSSLAIIIGAQINMNLFIVDFKVSIGIMLFPVALTLLDRFPLIPATFLSAAGVCLSRSLVFWFQYGQFEIARFIPEMFFYLVFGMLFSLYCQRNDYQVSLKSVPWLLLFDYLSNLVELILRLQGGAFSLASQTSIILVALSRAVIISCFFVCMKHYKFGLLRREHVLRYQRLLLLISKLNGEVIWMRKNTKLVEETMSKSYQLYQKMSDENIDEDLSRTALEVAKDIHEVKKEYMLILRGLSDALELNLKDDGMYLQDILLVLKRSLEGSVSESRELNFNIDIEENLYTTNHYFLMSVFRNLLNNAIEASDKQQIQLKFHESCDDDFYIFQISDNGPGIDPDNIDQIFSPGFSTKINYETGEINRGLGLNLVQDLVENQWNGKISAKSVPGNTVFTIKIPKKEWKERL